MRLAADPAWRFGLALNRGRGRRLWHLMSGMHRRVYGQSIALCACCLGPETVVGDLTEWPEPICPECRARRHEHRS